MAWACLFLAQSSCHMGPPRRWRRFRVACGLLVHQMLWHQPNEHSIQGDRSPDQLADASLACEQCSVPMRAPEHVLAGQHRCACAVMAAASTEHRLQHWGLPACGQRVFPELDSMTITLPRGMGMPIFSTEQLPHGPCEAMVQVSCCMRPAGAPNALASAK